MRDHHSSSPIKAYARRDALKLAGAAALGMALVHPIFAASYPIPLPQNILSPDGALARLIRGNQRYVAGKSKRQDFVAERGPLIGGQNPYAGILSCADSRVAPEFAFDTGRGDLFVVRVAGNFANSDAIASFEYSVAVLGVPLIVVLGHEACGAVSSAIKEVKADAEFPGHIPSLLKNLTPAVKSAEHQSGDLLHNATVENVRLTVEKLKKSPPILSKAVESGKLRIVGGIYDLTTGRVNFL